MEFRIIAGVVAGAIFLLGMTSATSAVGVRDQTKIKLDSKAALGHHDWLYAGRVVCGGTLRLIGVKSGGGQKTLDWTLTSVPGHAWALTGTRTGFQREFIEVRKSRRCTGDKVRVFQR
jgi:hypothetical protein